MRPTGTVEDDGRTLVLTRRFAAPIDDVWASVTESERTARWFGTWTGDPSTGSVLVTMNAEAEPAEPTRFDIVTCEPPRLLTVSADDAAGHWFISLRLDEDGDGTTLVFRQEQLEPGSVADIGPGWEWYLDRLLATVVGGPVPSLADFDSTYMPLSEAYRSLVR